MNPKHGQSNRSEMVHVRLTPEQRQALQAIAEQDGATESEIMRRLVADEVRRRQPKDKR